MEDFVAPFSDFDRLREEVRFGDFEAVTWRLRTLRRREPRLPEYSSLLADAIRGRHIDILRFLLHEGVPIIQSAVKAAVAMHDIDSLCLLFEWGWDINNPISENEPSVLSMLLDDIEAVSTLLQQGADPNATCGPGETPLSHAVAYASIDTIELLLKWFSSLEKGYLMHCAVDRQPFDPLVIKLLAAHGARYDEILWSDPESFQYRGYFTRGTPLHHACKSNLVSAARILLDLGADPEKLSVKDNAEVHPTPREIAYQSGDPEMIVLFQNKKSGQQVGD